MNLKKIVEKIAETKLNIDAGQAAKEYQDKLIKPKGSLGALEEISIKLAEITGNFKYEINNKEAIIMCGDHGFSHLGVSAYPKEVTYQMTQRYLTGNAGMNVIARANDTKFKVVDVGIDGDINLPGLFNKKVRKGTRDFTKGAAMTIEETLKAIEIGMEIANISIDEGVDLIAPGEMGIGNTTSSAALLSAFTGLSPEDITGRGSFINDEALKRKSDIIKKALEINRIEKGNPLDILAKVGGLEIAAIVGVIFACSVRRIPIVIDGLIVSAAALTAMYIAPGCEKFMFSSHASVEKGHAFMLKLLGLKPLFDFKLRLGEATGAIMAMQIIQTAAKVICEMDTFNTGNVTCSDKSIEFNE